LDTIVFDYASVRRNDTDGHLFVGSSVISAAQINGYAGREIPGYAQLGLDPDRQYKMLRDPAALEAAVPGLHGKPLLIRHRAQTSKDYDPDVTIGAVMNPTWVSPNVMAELEVWHPDGVRAIESGAQTDLSAGYHFTPVMEPGVYNGQPYEGRMTAIKFNHVAIVKSGRVDGATVGDEQPEPEFLEMNKTDFYYALNRAEDRAVERVAAIRQAEHDCARFLRRNMAFDTDPEQIYRDALVELGCDPEDIKDLDLAALKKVFQHMAGGSQLRGVGVAGAGSALDAILAATSPQKSTLDAIFEGATAPQLTAGLALTGYTGNEATAATTRSRGMAGDSAAETPLSAILKSIGAKAPVDMSPRRKAAAAW
jgi:hypothetical protein